MVVSTVFTGNDQAGTNLRPTGDWNNLYTLLFVIIIISILKQNTHKK